MNKYQHIVYNPQLAKLANILKDFDNSEWQLSHVVPVTMYEWVIVLEKWICDDNENNK